MGKADNTKKMFFYHFSFEAFHYAEYFIVFISYMLYQLVNKTLETRLLFLLKPICSIIYKFIN